VILGPGHDVTAPNRRFAHGVARPARQCDYAPRRGRNTHRCQPGLEVPRQTGAQERDSGIPGYINFEIETEIARPPGDVFAYVTDWTKLATWQTNTLSAVPEQQGPIGLGSRIREVHRAPGGLKIHELVEVEEYVPGCILGLRMIEGPPVNGRIRLEPTERGTLFRFQVYGQPTGVTRFAEPLIRFILKRNFTAFCANLKRVLEDARPKS